MVFWGSYRMCVAILVALPCAFGNRIKLRNVAEHSRTPNLNVKWRKETTFICLKKWERFRERFINKFCLADLEEAIEADLKLRQARQGGKVAPKLRVAKELSACQSKSEPHMMKVCDLKGKEFSYRLSYSRRAHVPKKCFFKSAGIHLAAGNVPINLVKAAVSWDTCGAFGKLPAEAQNTFLNLHDTKDLVAMTTTTTSSIDEVSVDASVEELRQDTSIESIVPEIQQDTLVKDVETEPWSEYVDTLLRKDVNRELDETPGSLVPAYDDLTRDPSLNESDNSDPSDGIDLDDFEFSRLKGRWTHLETINGGPKGTTHRHSNINDPRI